LRILRSVDAGGATSETATAASGLTIASRRAAATEVKFCYHPPAVARAAEGYPAPPMVAVVHPSFLFSFVARTLVADGAGTTFSDADESEDQLFEVPLTVPAT